MTEYDSSPRSPRYVLRVPAAYGLTRVEITTSTGTRDAISWELGDPTPRGVWGLTTSRSDVLPEPFIRAYPDLADLVGLPHALAEIDDHLAATMEAPQALARDARGGDGPRGPVSVLPIDPDLASALANLREQVLVAVRIGRLDEVPLVRGYVDDERGTTRVLESVWLDFGAFLTHAEARVDEWRLQERWYLRRPRWIYRTADLLPRRARMDAVPPLRMMYGLFPRGMHRTLFGSYLLHVAAHLDLVEVSGPPPLATLDEARAAEILGRPDRDGFVSTAVHAQMRSDPAGALWERALNGIHPFALGGVRPYVASVSFARGTNHVPAGSARRSAGTFLPDVEIEFAPAGDGLTVRKVTASHNESYWSADHPGHPLWDQLLNVARSVLTLAGEIDVHVMAHVLAEHVQVALHASLPPTHRVRRLLEPHLDGVDVINYAGDWLILGEDGVLPALTPLTPEDVAARTADALAAAWEGYRTFRPRLPLCGRDVYAAAAQVFWAALDPYVRGWLEGVTIDAELVGFGSLLSGNGPVGRAGARPELTFRDAEDLVQFCKFVIFYATFLHGWVNDAQWDDGGDPDLSPLAVRALPDASLPYAEWVKAAAPTRVNAAFQMIISNALTRFDVGFALHDDVYPNAPAGFRALVEGLPAPFADRHPTDRRLEKGWIRSRLNS